MEESERSVNKETKDNKTDYSKAELKSFLLKQIKGKCSLEELKKYVKENRNRSLEVEVIAYMERKYIEYCSYLWLDDLFQLFKGAIKSKKDEDFLVSIESIRHIKDIPKDLQISDYYKLLNANRKLISDDFEKTLILKIRNIYLQLLLKYNTIAKQELEFIDHFSSYLDSSKNIHHIISKLDLSNFICCKTSFHSLLVSIEDLENNSDFDILPLKEIAKKLQKEKDYTFLNKIKKSIDDIIKPAEIVEKILDDRWIVEVKCRNLKISNVLSCIEYLLTRNSEIVEVQIIITSNLHIDTNLEKNIWHGKNIFTLAKNVIVMGNVTWDVSGKNSEDKYETDAGTNDDGSGKDGSDGYPGENGGNVLILATNITNAEMFLINSNGGNGSDGQDGGNGIRGANALGSSARQYLQYILSVKLRSSTPRKRIKILNKIIRYIKAASSVIHCEWYGGSNLPEGDVFLEASTRQGCRMTFSYCHGGFTQVYQSYVLFKGSLGEPGKTGGRHGLGGRGGCAGRVDVRKLVVQEEFNVKKYMNNGDDGKAGKAGEVGENGKNYWDMGYMDHQFWPESVIYNSSGNKLNIIYYSENDLNCVWCPYKNAYAEIQIQ